MTAAASKAKPHEPLGQCLKCVYLWREITEPSHLSMVTDVKVF